MAYNTQALPMKRTYVPDKLITAIDGIKSFGVGIKTGISDYLSIEQRPDVLYRQDVLRALYTGLESRLNVDLRGLDPVSWKNAFKGHKETYQNFLELNEGVMFADNNKIYQITGSGIEPTNYNSFDDVPSTRGPNRPRRLALASLFLILGGVLTGCVPEPQQASTETSAPTNTPFQPEKNTSAASEPSHTETVPVYDSTSTLKPDAKCVIKGVQYAAYAGDASGGPLNDSNLDNGQRYIDLRSMPVLSEVRLAINADNCGQDYLNLGITAIDSDGAKTMYEGIAEYNPETGIYNINIPLEWLEHSALELMVEDNNTPVVTINMQDYNPDNFKGEDLKLTSALSGKDAVLVFQKTDKSTINANYYIFDPATGEMYPVCDGTGENTLVCHIGSQDPGNFSFYLLEGFPKDGERDQLIISGTANMIPYTESTPVSTGGGEGGSESGDTDGPGGGSGGNCTPGIDC